MFDPRSPYSRRMWHYDSGRPLSVAQLIALGSLDARTAAVLWVLIERHHSLIVSGPTDPTPGIGKTTTLNALLDFLPGGSTLVYTAGMYEDFSFRDQVDSATTCVLANEVSDHLRIYMWGRVARTFLALPEAGFAVATSCHADTVDDVLDMLLRDLRLPLAAAQRLGIIANIGLVGRVWPPRRRFLTVNLLAPAVGNSGSINATGSASVGSNGVGSNGVGSNGVGSNGVGSNGVGSGGTARFEVRLLPLARWDARTDTQVPATTQVLDEVASFLGMPLAALEAALERRRVCLEQLAQGRGVGQRAFREAVEALAAEATASAGTDAVTTDRDDEESE
jgi:hypothetical protein